eukprot:7387148-Prymnesium_polylepis.1
MSTSASASSRTRVRVASSSWRKPNSGMSRPTTECGVAVCTSQPSSPRTPSSSCIKSCTLQLRSAASSGKLGTAGSRNLAAMRKQAQARPSSWAFGIGTPRERHEAAYLSKQITDNHAHSWLQ